MYFIYLFSALCQQRFKQFRDLNELCGPHCTSGQHPHVPKNPVHSQLRGLARGAITCVLHIGAFPFRIIWLNSSEAQIKCKFLNLKIFLWHPKFSPSHRILTQTSASSFSARKIRAKTEGVGHMVFTNSNITSKQTEKCPHSQIIRVLQIKRQWGLAFHLLN